jgi:asparagine synthase (glutamine-hydrolysing)
MCGIAGSINIPFTNIKNIQNNLSHRGPNSSGFFSFSNVFLIHTRLSIQDLSSNANQPMTIDGLTIVFNGEIYNHLDLRTEFPESTFKTSSDTETLLHLYKKYSFNFLNTLDGMFSFAIFDKPRNIIFFARDRAGKKPLYFYKNNNQFLFASELETMRKNILLEIDYNSINEYLHSGYINGKKTPYINVNKLSAGHYAILKLKNMQFEEKKWWAIDKFYTKTFPGFLNSNISIFDDLLHKSVKRRISSSDLEVGVFLSGGIDSGLITAIASNYKSNLKTFTVAMPGEFNEEQFALKVAQKYNTNHTILNISFNNLKNDIEKILINYGEPFFDSSAIPSYYISQEAKKHITVILNGDGADELFGGYRRYVPFKYFNLFKTNKGLHILINFILKFLPYPNQKISKYNYLYRLLNIYSQNTNTKKYFAATNDLMYDLNNVFSENYNVPDNDETIRKLLLKYKNSFKVLLYLDFTQILVADLLVKMDIATMAHSLEGRSPFLSKEILEYAPSLPDNLKINHYNTKYFLREYGKKYLPEIIIQQPKRGFEVPLSSWVNNELKEIINDYLLKSNLSGQFIKSDFIQNLLDNKIRIPIEKRTKIIWQLFCLEVWYKNYLIN